MASFVPVSTHVVESAIITEGLDFVWNVVSQLNFSWWSLVEDAVLINGLSARCLDSTIRINFKDGYSWIVAIRELSSINHKFTFEVISCEPNSPVSAALHSVSLERVTSSPAMTFVKWTTDFSSDASLEVVTDASFKRKDALKDLAKIVVKSRECEKISGMGNGIEIPAHVSNEKVWEVLLLKIQKPNLFLPVTDVLTRTSDDGCGTYREMSLGPNRIIENIFTDASIHEVKFVVNNDEYEHVNIILTDPVTGTRTLEFYKRHSISKEKVSWAAPKKVVLGGIAKVLGMAATL